MIDNDAVSVNFDVCGNFGRTSIMNEFTLITGRCKSIRTVIAILVMVCE